MSEILNLQQVAVNFDDKSILSDIGLQLDCGEILGLLGPSGCGKTTLLNTLAGFVTLAGGEIRIDGDMLISPKHNIAPEHRHIGMIFQDYALFPHLTVAQNIAFGITKLTKSEQKQRIDELLELLKLTEHSGRYPHQLSGGQQQRVAIARALAPRPKLLLLDEPFSNIDARLRNELMLEIRQLLKKLQMTAIFVTHNKDEVFTFADKVAVMHQGKLLQLGKPVEVCQQPNCWQVADFLQLGSWIPYSLSGKDLTTAIGTLTDITDVPKMGENSFLLIKPQDVEICEDETQGHNVTVNHISVTEQGYHYHLASSNAPSQLTFDHLSLYSPQILALGQHLQVTIKPHDLLVFAKDPHSFFDN
ncbi:ABC transporter ATP-binding protein [Thalassomonas haliotis]|uniref:ABC transporter ATP-binding protein n=1 Tax=Thalassomonas haliotis TaxID=485448 RepID=A0ABY7VC72_9GAMM|nr:ABC transporter ATP-binding protein [Thalassomonas haliotis]WDE11252.1 ABC transporter ATP-binding protein [Thalassomonas haliotis]